MTVLTDYVLGVLCVILAVRLGLMHAGHCRRYWAWALVISAAAAFCGGTYHGFLPVLSGRASELLWTSTLWFIGCAAFCGTLATAWYWLSPRWRRGVGILAGMKLITYLWLTTRTGDFLVAIVDYSTAFGFVLIAHGWAWYRTRDPSAGWIVSGVLVSFLAAGIQAAGLAPHPQFNHNDLYHVVQMIGMWMLYRGALGMD